MDKKYIKFIEWDEQDLKKACKIAEENWYKPRDSPIALRFEWGWILICGADWDYFVRWIEAGLINQWYTEIKRTKEHTQYADWTKVKLISCSNKHDYGVGTIVTIKNCYGSNERCWYLYRTNQGTDPICSIDIELVEEPESEIKFTKYSTWTKVKIVANTSWHWLKIWWFNFVVCKWGNEVEWYDYYTADGYTLHSYDIELIKEVVEDRLWDNILSPERPQCWINNSTGTVDIECNNLNNNKNNTMEKINQLRADKFFKNENNLVAIETLDTLLNDSIDLIRVAKSDLNKVQDKLIWLNRKVETATNNQDVATLKHLISSTKVIRDFVDELKWKTISKFESAKSKFDVAEYLKD